MFRKLLMIGAMALTGLSCSSGGGGQANIEAWVAPIEVRVYQGAFSRDPQNRTVEIQALAEEVASAQVVVRSDRDIRALAGSQSDLAGPGGVIPAAAAQVRYGGFIPVDETQTMTADPLLEDPAVDVPANLAQPVWLTIHVPADAAAGVYTGPLKVSSASGQAAEFTVRLEVLPAVLPPPHEWRFHLNIWQDPTPVAKAHEVKLWSEEHWRILERYAANFAAHGMKAVMTHITYDPWDGVRGWASDNMVEWKYPGEFRFGDAGRFEWDFTVFDRYVELMLAAGVDRSIDMYSLVMGPGGTLKADIRYLDTAAGAYRNIPLTVGDPLWREIWKAFLPELRRHLKEKGWFDKAILGFDEKPQAVMREIYEFISREAPDFRIASSGGYPGDQGKWANELVIHIDELLDPERYEQLQPLIKQMYEAENSYVTFYTACMPHYPNTFIFSGLRESRLLPWLAAKWGLDGYIRWAVNLYPEDPWHQPLFTWPSGDMFFVYPGKDGPLDSMRWELMRQGIQDYEALRMARNMAKAAGRDDLLEKLENAVRRGTIIDSCRWIPYIQESRALVNEVIRELAA